MVGLRVMDAPVCEAAFSVPCLHSCGGVIKQQLRQLQQLSLCCRHPVIILSRVGPDELRCSSTCTPVATLCVHVPKLAHTRPHKWVTPCHTVTRTSA
jgi:hypothetical protein